MWGVSQSHLNEQIKKITGKTVGTLIREAQFSEAKRLLVNTELNVTEIAENMRFQDTAYFCRAFKRQVGMSPSQYRAKCRENKVSQ
ncbi:helix-turn-helix transcriptional regulator [Emergencia sp. 1XD21-10]|uniref:helix-turn-helix domain-containing protein n=1 Tax=Emergencia sp. 1XD21-10 TaxID=2304569 RepID=UPI0013794DD2|nr:AraC family transcriptional regulator [Emergencia sp. 1XD21-10]